MSLPYALTGRVLAAAALPPALLRPLPPDVAPALSRVEGAGVILGLWLPMVLFGHIFAAAFLLHGLFLYMPSLKRKLRQAFLSVCCRCGRGGFSSPLRSGSEGAAAVAGSARNDASERERRRRQPPPADPGGGGDGALSSMIADGACPARYGLGKEVNADVEEEKEEEEEEGVSQGIATRFGRVGESDHVSGMYDCSSNAPEAALGYDDDTRLTYGKGGRRQTRGSVCLEWAGLSLAVPSPRGEGLVRVLRDVGGRAPAGAVTALLGPSGAGKSTLLDILALRGSAAPPEDQQQQQQQHQSPQPPRHPHLPPPPPQPQPQPQQQQQPGCSGVVLVNGVPRNTRAFLAMSSYVPQEDAFLPQLTVREALLFTGQLVAPPPQCGVAAVAGRAAAVAAALGLGPHMDSLIGGVLPGGLLLRGLSGGERKRLSIGQGLMSRPRLLLLDEPTSGLDSFAAAVVMSHLAALAAGHGAAAAAGGGSTRNGSGGNGGGRPPRVTVVASLHQPRAAIWDLVNQVVVLGRGRLLYCGPPRELQPWFAGQLGYCYRPKHHGLISDWVMDLIALPTSTTTATATGTGGASSAVLALAAVLPPAAGTATATITHYQPIAGCGGGGAAAAADSAVFPGGFGGGTIGGCYRMSSEGGASDSSIDSGSGGRQVMATLAELDAAADAFATAVLTAPPAPGVSAGVTDYANVQAVAADNAATTAAVALAPTAMASIAGGAAIAARVGGSRTGRNVTVRFADEVSAGSTTAVTAAAVPPSPRQPFSAAVAAAVSRWIRQYRMLVWREWLIATRNPADVAGRMLTFVWVGLFTDFVTYGIPADATGIARRSVLLFALVFFFLVMPFVFMSLFAADKRFFLMEAAARGGGLYTTSAYYAAKVTAVTPLNIAVAITFDWIGYGMLGYRRNVLDVVRHTTCAVLMSLISLQWMQACVAFSPNQDIAFCSCVAFCVLNLLLSTQFLGSLKLAFPWIGHLRNISALDLSWRGLMWSEFHDRSFQCGPEGSSDLMGTGALGLYSQFVPANSRFSGIGPFMSARGTGPCLASTNALLSYFGINESVGTTVGYLLAYLAAVHSITYLALRRALAAKWRRARGKAGGEGGGQGFMAAVMARARPLLLLLQLRRQGGPPTEDMRAATVALVAATEV